jgi:hypothetical protein
MISDNITLSAIYLLIGTVLVAIISTVPAPMRSPFSNKVIGFANIISTPASLLSIYLFFTQWSWYGLLYWIGSSFIIGIFAIFTKMRLIDRITLIWGLTFIGLGFYYWLTK